jgi:anti-sigma factor ChrR (cupin superfamily)
MNCGDWEERIALYAGGDLGAPDSSAVERHLAGCGECRGFAQGISDSLALLRAAHEEPIAAGHYAAVRAAVLDRLARGPSPWPRWLWAPALAAGLAVAGFFLTVRPVQKPRVYVAAVRPPVELPAVPVRPAKAVPQPAPVRRPRPQRTVAPKPPTPVEPLVVKLITNDPDVVIYWIAD